MKENEELDMILDIPQYSEWKSILEPETGWSINHKFHIKDKDNSEYILRVSDISLFDEKKKEYDNIIRISELDINSPTPIAFGICNKGKSVYMLLDWIDGVAIEDVIRRFDSDIQYDFGIKSGQLLRKIHNHSIITPTINWEYEYGKHIDYILSEYYKTNISIRQESAVINYISNNRHMLKNRPQVIRHGDYHVGNLIITNDNHIGVIDFDKCCPGDAWEEFGGIVWAARLSGLFAKGQVDGYFDRQIPEDFFVLLALYIGVYALEHVVRSANHHSDERSINGIMSNTDFMSAMFDNFSTHIPNWYN